MAQQTINIGTVENDRTGDRPRVAGGKINANFTELYAYAATSNSGIVNVTTAGAVATGSTLDAVLVANTAAINSVLTTAPAAYIPAGCHYKRSQVTIPQGKLVVDDSRGQRVTSTDYWWQPWPKKPLLLAHRGYADLAVENTLGAFGIACQLGADGIETDMHTTSDGVPVIFHDDDLTRMSGGASTALLRTLTLAQLQAIDIGTPWSPRYAGARVPTLAEVLDFSANRFEYLQMEIKGYRTQADIDLYLTALRDRGLERRTTIMSFDRTDLDYVRARNQVVEVGQYVSSYSATTMRSLALLGRAVLGVPDTSIVSNPAIVAECRAEGVEVAAWTLLGNEGGDKVQMFIDLGVARLVADNTFSRTA